MSVYSKPKINFLPLEVATNLASSCEIQATHDVLCCPVSIDGFPFTLINIQVCESYGPEMTDMICYHVPMGDGNVFSS